MKSSGAKSGSPPERPTFFLDRNLGKATVAGELRQAGFAVEIHDERFPLDARDQDWIPVVGQKGWVILTKDQAIMRRYSELLAIARGYAKVYALVSGSITGKDMAAVFAKAAPKIEKSSGQMRAPYIAKIFKS